MLKKKKKTGRGKKLLGQNTTDDIQTGGEKGDLGGVETELVEGKLPISLSR